MYKLHEIIGGFAALIGLFSLAAIFIFLVWDLEICRNIALTIFLLCLPTFFTCAAMRKN